MPPPASTLDEFLTQLDAEGRLVHVERFRARAAVHGSLDRPLPDDVGKRVGLDGLWSHQAEAINHARAGRSVVVATGTASGKSLCYQLPIAEAVADPVRPGTALLLFPTKALAHDQLRSLAEFEFPDVVAATYDGDSNPEQRTWVRNNANVVLTNPEMLHHGLLPHHGRWSTFLMRLRFVVVDELHVLRGIFGTHVAHLLRRLRRIAQRYGSDPTFIFSSATIGQPSRLAGELCGLPVAEVSSDGSPRGPRTFALLNPPIVDEESGVRTSTNAETAVVTAGLVRSGHRTISFCRSRKGTELVAADVARRLPADQRDQVKPYRAGYLAAERREIEDELFSGRLRAVVATSALELGVDIGGLDAVVLNGFPGTIASMWQQAGRAGRELQESASVLVAGDDALDQWLMAHPHEVFERQPEPAVINIANPFIAVPHLACAAYEQPLARSDERWWPAELLHDGVRDLVRDDALRLRIRRGEPQAVWATRGYPSRGMGLRNGGGREFRIAFADGTLVGTVDE
ncbi:MAG: DEAD/DEAH box helicase, partial [Acidimicrobiales bacterium]|nr:DEAD/DEAH box helicase [Acidimicrobiales bacterium]